MTDEVEVQEEQSTAVDDQAAFEAGYNGEPVEVAEPTPAAEEEAPVEEPAQEAEPERNQWGYTDDEMKSLLSKAAKVDEIERNLEAERQRIYGKLGEYNRTIQAMQSANQGGSLTVRQLNHLRGEFPELADLLEKDFGEAQPVKAEQAPEPVQTQQAPMVDPEALEKKLSETYERKFLNLQHPDWESVVKTTDFRTWLGLQPPDYQAEMNASWDSGFVAKGLSSFKNWYAKANKASTKKTARLEAAVAPTGVGNSGPPAMDEADAFLAGWKTVRG